MSERTTYGLVLAGGKSRRMGQDKALLQRDGKSQIGYLVSMLEPLLDRVFVSARQDQSEEPERQRYAQIIDRYADMGPVAGILTAMEDYPGADWVVVACDLPNVDEATIRHLLENTADAAPFTAYRSSHDDLPEPLCALYRSGSDAIIRQFVKEGLHCPRKMLIRSDTALLTQPDPASLDNVNTPDDLRSSVLEGAG